MSYSPNGKILPSAHTASLWYSWTWTLLQSQEDVEKIKRGLDVPGLVQRLYDTSGLMIRDTSLCFTTLIRKPQEFQAEHVSDCAERR